LRIKDVWTNYNSSFHSGKDNIKDPSYFKKFKAAVVGKKILETTRRAKNILIEIEGGDTILVHMKMTGHLLYGKYEKAVSESGASKKEEWIPASKKGPLADPFNRHIRLVFALSDGSHLVLSDMRKFAKVTLIAKDELEKSLHLMHIGIEPFDKKFKFGTFKAQLMKRKNGRIKNVLMDQSLIAGIGNIYSDEALWLSCIHPEEPVQNIPEDSLKLLYTSSKEVLKKGINFGGDSMSDYRNINGEQGEFQMHHNAYRRTGKKCGKPKCGGTIVRKVVGGRSAHFCDTHQKLIKYSKSGK
jgi:formamidopyrimidine-DNA glycosylase